MNIKNYTGLLLLSFFSLIAQADYQLDNAASTLNFVSIKKSKIGEVHSFTQFSGRVNEAGLAQLTVNLNSVSTGIAIRDQRMKDVLFETKLFHSAAISSQLNIARVSGLQPGQVLIFDSEFSLALHGQSKLIPVSLQVVGLEKGALLVSSAQPLVLNAADFSLTKGVQELMMLANLPSIASAVPVMFSLVFKPTE